MRVSDQKAHVQTQFRSQADYYATSPVHARGQSLARLVTLTEPQAQDVVLDVATAAGHNALSFAPHVQQVTGLDLTPEMLSKAQELAHQRGIGNIRFSQGDAEYLPFQNDCFDIVTCRIAPHHFPDVMQAVREMARVCQPGGRVAICDNLTPDVPDIAAYINMLETRRDPSHYWAYSLVEWCEFMQRAGLDIVVSETLAKPMQFALWAGQMDMTEDQVAELYQELLRAPSDVREVLKPRLEADELIFQLTEGILIGRKPVR